MQSPNEFTPVNDDPPSQPCSREPSPIIGSRNPPVGDHNNAAGSSTSGQDTRTGFVPISFMQTMMQEMMSKFIETTANAFNAHKPKLVPRVRSLEHIYVPPFDPDDRTDTIQVWCKNLEDLKIEYELTDREILNLSRKNLRGRAAEWSRRNYTSLTTWIELKTRLVETFADEVRYYDNLTLFMEYTSEQASSLAEYATRKWELARKAIGVEMTDQRLVEAVISGMSDFRIRSDLLRLTPKNLPQLIQSLNSYKRKRPNKDTEHTILSKRQRPNNPDNKQKRCHKCHKLGHLQKDCHSAASAQETQKGVPLPPNSTNTKIPGTCTFCKRKGHSFDNCFQRLNKKARDEKSSSTNINALCMSKNRCKTARIDDRDFSCLLDSGAECSLIRDSVGNSVKGKMSYETTVLKGVGSNAFNSSSKKICEISIDGLTLELEFILVPDQFIQYDILLGQNLFETPGIKITFTNNETYISRESCNINFVQN